MDTVYLTRAQVEALYRLTFKQGRSRLGSPRVGVQIRSTADADSVAIFDSVLDKANELAAALVDSEGRTGGWEI